MEKPFGALNMHQPAKIKGLIKPLMLFRLRSHSLGGVFRAGENRRKINTSMQSIGGVVLIRWLQSALIPISTAQSAAEE